MPRLLIQHIQDQRWHTIDSHFSQPSTIRWCHTSQNYTHFSGFLAKRMGLTRSRTSAKCRLSLCSLLRILSISHWRSSIIVSKTDTRDSAVSTLSCSLENCNQNSVSASILNRINIFQDFSELIFLLFIITWIYMLSAHLLLWWRTTPWTALNFTLAESQHSNDKTKQKMEKEQQAGNNWQSTEATTSAYSKPFFFKIFSIRMFIYSTDHWSAWWSNTEQGQCLHSF